MKAGSQPPSYGLRVVALLLDDAARSVSLVARAVYGLVTLGPVAIDVDLAAGDPSFEDGEDVRVPGRRKADREEVPVERRDELFDIVCKMHAVEERLVRDLGRQVRFLALLYRSRRLERGRLFLFL